jgi:thiol-disulfide isomerase/thioredoxin
MKRPLRSALAVLVLLTTAAHAQKVGDTVTLDALAKAEWIQGAAPTAWEPGKLYILECWATWCGPCVANIPHVDALFDKYADKGLRVIGVDVWEDGKDTVAAFVKKKGDGMSYPVVYTGKGSAFENEWLKTANVLGIPHAFLVKDGKVLAMTHPAGLTDQVVEDLLSGGAAGDAVLTKLNQAAAAQNAVQAAKQHFSEASKKKDAAGMTAAAEELNTAQPGNMYVPLFRNEALIAAKDWAGVEKAAADAGDPGMHRMVVNSLATSIVKVDDVPADTLTKITAAYLESLPADKKTSMDGVNLARLYWKTGQKDKALEQAKSSVELAKADTPGFHLPSAPFEKFAGAVDKGDMPTPDEFSKWFQAALAEQKAEKDKAAEAKPAGE